MAYYNYNKKFDIINKICFNNKLPKIKIVVVEKWRKGTDKRTLGTTHYHDKIPRIDKIELLKCKNKGDMTVTLMHEMLHCQYILDKNDMNHTKEFRKKEWKLANRLKKHCQEIYGCDVN